MLENNPDRQQCLSYSTTTMYYSPTMLFYCIICVLQFNLKVFLSFVFDVHSRLHLNDKHYYVEPPPKEKVSSEEIERLGDVRSLVAQVKYIL